MTLPRRVRLLLSVLAILAAATSGVSAAPDKSFTLAGPFTLVDADGQAVSTSAFTGKWLLIYFGYTHCADWCPTSLSAIAEAMDQIGPAAQQVQPLFITVDPERDKGPILRAFTASFDKHMIGLGGSSDQIAAVAGALGVEYEKVLQGNDDYVIDHSVTLSLIDPTGRRAETFEMAEPYQIAAKVMAALRSTGTPLTNVNNAAAFK